MKKSSIEQLFIKDTDYIGADFQSLFSIDLKKTLNEYFILQNGINVEIKKGSDYLVTISFTATDVKSFGVVPK